MGRFRKVGTIQLIGLSSLLGMGVVFSPQLLASPINGQVDNFQSGIANWQNGHSSSSDSVAPNGMGGAGDSYLEIQSGGANNPKLLTFNRSQWTGDFVDAGVTTIAMDLLDMDPGTATLSIRIGLRAGTGGSTTPGYVTTTPFLLPHDGAWHHATFAINIGSLTPIQSPAPLSTFLTSVAEFRILDASSSGTLEGDAVTSAFGVDNITALPEPSAVALTAMVVGFALIRRRVCTR